VPHADAPFGAQPEQEKFVSKNVAVFVDVANIFYAAKAAGIDIDYITLLKAATAGRDFVRAYAYTGLDPENDNQRQFHAFLARNGYKVISKDIRKYGDGRMKANLDIELVVDLLKTARNLDIAVVVSGDGDFASAIRAVQEMGVRVEVISFRGNTSSDLMDVADVFLDIAQVARVDKTSGRSGRRVAAEGDLSMTEVPEKETEGAPRRRRAQRREERPAVAEPEANVTVLPGEHLSRAGSEAEGAPEETSESAGEPVAAGDGGPEAAGEDARRRRRRRGGRGRGRGRRSEGELAVAGAQDDTAAYEDEEDTDFDELPPTQPAHQTFGSVWDTQLGMASPAIPRAVDIDETEPEEGLEELEEPEVPEYLLAERRQSGQRPRGRTGRGRSAYQQALDRERFGRGTAQPSLGGRQQGGNRERGRGARQPGRGRPTERLQRSEAQPQQRVERPASSEPWSEVPPELEELLRAEIARKAQPAAPVAPPPEAAAPRAEATEETAPKPAARRRTTRTKKAEPAAVAEAAAAPTEATEVPAPKPAARRRTTRTKKAEPAAVAEAAAPPAAATEEAPKKTVRRRRATGAKTEG
jgi:uncharacterized LabA/DUF88 family protein